MSSDKPQTRIALNKKARHDYFIMERLEAGISLQGWEVKSLRAGRVQIQDSYILLKQGEAFLFGALITPLPTTATHSPHDSQRTRKLLLNRREINKLIGAKERKGLSVIPIALYWKRGKIKIEIAVAQGKKKYDKRQDQKTRDWQRQKSRLLKHS